LPGGWGTAFRADVVPAALSATIGPLIWRRLSYLRSVRNRRHYRRAA
jgi:hypothetical protein